MTGSYLFYHCSLSEGIPLLGGYVETCIQPLIFRLLRPLCPTLHPRLSLLPRTAFNFTQTKRQWQLCLTMTPNTQIEAVYLLKTTSDALIESLATEAASCLRNHLPRTHPCLLVRAKTVERDSTSNSSSPLSPVKSISLPKGAAPQRWLYKGQQNHSTDSVNKSTLCKHFSLGLPTPFPMSPPMLFFLPFRFHSSFGAQLPPRSCMSRIARIAIVRRDLY